MTSSRRPGEKAATLYDVARVAGVSHQTVSRFLRGQPGIRPDTVDRVERALVELDYQANVTARNLRNGRTGMITLAVPSLNQPYFAELAQSVIHAAREVGLTVSVETMEDERERELAVLSRSRGTLVDGVIFAPTAITAADLAELKLGFPVVLLGDRIFDSDFDHVAMANAAGARLAVQHLIDLGRRRIAVIGIEPDGNLGASQLRLRGYEQALAEAGIALDPRLTVHGGAWTRAAGAEAVQRLIDSGVPFDALFGFNDALALGALRGLLRAGYRVPEDVAVVGFDDTEDAHFSTPSLTTIAPGREEIARQAVELLNKRIKSRSTDLTGHLETEAPYRLVVRESTGEAPATRAPAD